MSERFSLPHMQFTAVKFEVSRAGQFVGVAEMTAAVHWTKPYSIGNWWIGASLNCHCEGRAWQ